MRIVFLGVMTLAVLGGCQRAAGTPDDSRHGRYAGVGLYDADRGWKYLAGVPKPADKTVATTADDTIVIVTVDGATGEIRQCGNYSGHCIAMNPWRAPPGPRQAAPVSLTAHEEAVNNEVAPAK